MKNLTFFFSSLIILAIASGACKKNESVTPDLKITDTLSVVEGTYFQYKAIIPVTLSSTTDKQVSFVWSTSNNTATAGEDYSAANASYIVFKPGETTKNIEVQIYSDSTFEPDETFNVTISNVQNAKVTTSRITVTIKNDDIYDPTPVHSDISFWLTKPDKSALLKKQSAAMNFSATTNQYTTINVDTTLTYQVMDGFGYAMTGGSAFLINSLTSENRDALLREMFSQDDNAIGVSYLRVSIGASDLSTTVFSYDDMPSGQTDVNLTNFNLGPDKVDLIPVLKAVLQLNPKIKILGSPWSPPVWMKTTKNSKGGSLLTEYYDVYARYLVRYITEMKLQGIPFRMSHYMAEIIQVWLCRQPNKGILLKTNLDRLLSPRVLQRKSFSMIIIAMSRIILLLFSAIPMQRSMSMDQPFICMAGIFRLYRLYIMRFLRKTFILRNNGLVVLANLPGILNGICRI